MLRLKDVTKYYGQRRVLNQVNYQFERGRIYGIIGPNGAGKSTLLRVITGFEKADGGKIFLQDKELSEPCASIACMWQKPYLFSTTVYENVAYGLRMRGIDINEIRPRVQQLLAKFKLEPLKEALATKISGGEGARVALARAIACGSPVIILDEPAANLDPLNTRLMEQTLLEVQQEENLTIIIVTHDMFQAKRLADYTIFLEDGVIKEAKDTRELFSNPKDPSTKQFLQGII